MSTNIGIDLMLSASDDGVGDLVIGDNGDFLTTEDYEAKLNPSLVKFEGFVCLHETIYRVLQANKGDWIRDQDFGANITEHVSAPVNSKLFLLEQKIETELLKDDRIKSVDNVKMSFVDQKTVKIEIK